MKKEIILQEEIKIIINGYTRPVVIDNPLEKKVTAKFNLMSEDGSIYDYPSIDVWVDEEYDNIGQWTDDDLNKRIDEILGISYVEYKSII